MINLLSARTDKFLTNYGSTQTAGLGTGVQPSAIANLLGWFKASQFDAISDGTEVTAAWTDQSSLAVDATLIGSAGNRPTVKRNIIHGTMTALEGADKAGYSRSGMTLTSQTTWSLFAVLYFLSGAVTENNFFALGDGNTIGVRLGLTTGGKWNFVIPNFGGFASNETVSTGAWHYVTLVSTAGVRLLYVDGVALTWASTPALSQSGSATNFKLLEGNPTANYRLKGYLAEFAFYNSAITSIDRNNLHTYAKLRFGL